MIKIQILEDYLFLYKAILFATVNLINGSDAMVLAEFVQFGNKEIDDIVKSLLDCDISG